MLDLDNIAHKPSINFLWELWIQKDLDMDSGGHNIAEFDRIEKLISDNPENFMQIYDKIPKYILDIMGYS